MRFEARPLAGDPGAGHHQRRARRALEQHLLHPLPVLAEQVAVIAHEDDDRVVGEAEAIERVEQPADLGVEEGDRGVVGADDFALRLLASTPQLGGLVNQAGGGRLTRRPRRDRGGAGIRSSGYMSKYFFGAMYGQCGR